MAELPLAGAHRRRRVPLRELDRVETLADRALHVLRRHVLADAHEAFALAGVRGLGGDLRQALARHAADGLDPVGKLRRHEDSEAVVVLDAGARLRQERIGGLATAGRDEEIAGVALAVEDEAPDATLASMRCELARTYVAQVHDLRDLDADVRELIGDRERLVVGAEDDRPLAGLDGEVADQAADAVGEHHADEVVPREHERLLGRAGRDDDPLGAEAVQDGAGVDRDEASLPDPERARGCEDLDSGEHVVTDAGVLVDQNDAGTGLRGLESSRAARGAATDDEHSRSPVLGVVAPGVPGMRVELPETGGATQELLVQRPGGAWPDERAVVEPDRREGAADLVRQRHEVEIERPAHVLALDDRAFTDRLGAHANVRDAVHRHLAVRAVARAAEEPARSVVLERAREDPLACGEGRGRERVALEAGDLPACERERDRLRAVDPLAGPRLEPHAGFLDSGSTTSSTSLVRVSRSARNHSPQPVRCCHHSRCTPATLSRKYTYSVSSCRLGEPEGRVVTSPKYAYSSTGRGPQNGHERRKDIRA